MNIKKNKMESQKLQELHDKIRELGNALGDMTTTSILKDVLPHLKPSIRKKVEMAERRTGEAQEDMYEICTHLKILIKEVE